MENTRTLTALREAFKGKIYIYFADNAIYKRFLQDAEGEGFMFGTIKPSDSPEDDIISLGFNKQLSHPGFIGHIAFRCNGGDGNPQFYRIDYQKFVDGELNYFYEHHK